MDLTCLELPGGGLDLSLPVGCPVPKGNSKRLMRMGRRTVLIGPEAEKHHERAVRLAALAAAGGRRVRGPVALDVAVFLPLPALSAKYPTAWRAAALAGTEAPGAGCSIGRRRVGDRGNYLKLVEDALRDVVMDDDAAVVAGEVCKTWAPPEAAGYRVRVRPWRPGARWWDAAPESVADRPMTRTGPTDDADRPGRQLVGEFAALEAIGGRVLEAAARLLVETPRGRMDDATAALVRLGWRADGPAGRTLAAARARFSRVEAAS